MKKFICCLLSALLFTMPVYAGEIKGVEKIGGIEKIGDIPTGSITAIEKTDLEYAPSVHNVKSGLNEEYTFYSQLSDEGKQYYDVLEDNVMKMVNGTETVTTNITVNVGTGLDENTAINNALNIGFDGAKRGIVAFWYDNPQYFWFDINQIYHTIVKRELFYLLLKQVLIVAEQVIQIIIQTVMIHKRKLKQIGINL